MRVLMTFQVVVTREVEGITPEEFDKIFLEKGRGEAAQLLPDFPLVNDDAVACELTFAETLTPEGELIDEYHFD